MPKPMEARQLESQDEVAMLALEFGRLLMESGASASQVDATIAQVASGFGAERLDVRVGYASLVVSLGVGADGITRVRKVGALGVNQRLYDAVRMAASEIQKGSLTLAQAREQLDGLMRASAHHPAWLVAVAVAVACAAFGRLLDVDWAGVGAIFVGTGVAQMVRRVLAEHKVNVFLSTMGVAFMGSTVCGLAARWMAIPNVARAMVVTVLLLVPGVPAFNALLDILEGRPTLGSARAVWVVMILVFMSLGVWLALGLLGEGR